MRKLSVNIVLLLVGCLMACAAALAQNYPSKPVKITVPFPAGGGLDATVRIISKQLAERLGQPVVVENRPGAGGAIGTAEVVKAPADGYTLLAQSVGYAVSMFTEKNLPYDSRKDLTPILLYAEVPVVLVVNPKLPLNTPQELMQLARAKPGTVTFGAGDPMIRLMTDLFQQGIKADVQTIQYSGAGKAILDLMGGHINALFTSYVSVSSQIQAGSLRAIAVTGATRSQLAPDVPTLNETIVPGYDIALWNVLLARSNTPREILFLLNKELVAVLNTSEVADAFKAAGIKPIQESLNDVNQRMSRELLKWEAAAAGTTVK